VKQGVLKWQYSNKNYQRCWQAMSARWYPVKIKSNPQFLSASPTSIITVITSRSYGIASLSTQLGVKLTMTKALTNEELTPLFTAVGAIVVQWGQAEQTFDMIVATIYRSYGGETIRKKIPQPISEKIKFIRECSALDELKHHYSELGKLADDFDKLCDQRHDIIHGAVASFNDNQNHFLFAKLDLKNNVHQVRELEFDIEEFPKILDKFIALGADSVSVAMRLLDEMCNQA
jgi:hypothetical protein